MIEQAMTQLFGLKFDILPQYIRDGQNYKLIKLHGSVDWGREIIALTTPRAVPAILDVLDTLQLAEYRKFSSPPAKFPDGVTGFPALAIPVENKSEFNCPREHIESLATVIPQVTKIITIGWRATEQHFLKMLKSRQTGLRGSPDLMVVSGDLPGVTETSINLSLLNPGPNRKYPTITTGFSALIKDIDQLEQFLW
jgi:hypothetical protein